MTQKIFPIEPTSILQEYFGGSILGAAVVKRLDQTFDYAVQLFCQEEAPISPDDYLAENSESSLDLYCVLVVLLLIRDQLHTKRLNSIPFSSEEFYLNNINAAVNGIHCLDCVLGKFYDWFIKHDLIALADVFNRHFFPIMSRYKMQLNKFSLKSYLEKYKVYMKDDAELPILKDFSLIEKSFDMDCGRTISWWQIARYASEKSDAKLLPYLKALTAQNSPIQVSMLGYLLYQDVLQQQPESEANNDTYILSGEFMDKLAAISIGASDITLCFSTVCRSVRIKHPDGFADKATRESYAQPYATISLIYVLSLIEGKPYGRIKNIVITSQQHELLSPIRPYILGSIEKCGEDKIYQQMADAYYRSFLLPPIPFFYSQYMESLQKQSMSLDPDDAMGKYFIALLKTRINELESARKTAEKLLLNFFKQDKYNDKISELLPSSVILSESGSLLETDQVFMAWRFSYTDAATQSENCLYRITSKDNKVHIIVPIAGKMAEKSLDDLFKMSFVIAICSNFTQFKVAYGKKLTPSFLQKHLLPSKNFLQRAKLELELLIKAVAQENYWPIFSAIDANKLQQLEVYDAQPLAQICDSDSDSDFAPD